MRNKNKYADLRSLAQLAHLWELLIVLDYGCDLFISICVPERSQRAVVFDELGRTTVLNGYAGGSGGLYATRETRIDRGTIAAGLVELPALFLDSRHVPSTTAGDDTGQLENHLAFATAGNAQPACPDAAQHTTTTCGYPGCRHASRLRSAVVGCNNVAATRRVIAATVDLPDENGDQGRQDGGGIIPHTPMHYVDDEDHTDLGHPQRRRAPAAGEHQQ